MMDWRALDRQEKRTWNLKPAKPGQPATVKLKRKAPPVPYNVNASGAEPPRAASDGDEGSDTPDP